MPTPLQPPLVTLLVLGSLCACGHSSSGAFAGLDGSPGDAVAAHDAPLAETAPPGDDASSPTPEASTTTPDAGDEAGEAGTVGTLCVGLGGKCTDSSTCLCGVGSACTFDNVECTAGACAVSFAVPLDAGDDCCAECQSTYDACTTSSQACLSQWMTCNDACSGECPVLCLAAQGMSGG